MMRWLLIPVILSFVTGLGVSIVLFCLGSLQLVLAFNSIRN